MEKLVGQGEKRQNPRHPISQRVAWTEISSIGTTRTIRGQLHDISSGGVCLLTSQRMEESRFVLGSISLSNVPVKLPSLMRVCWVKRMPKGIRFRVGLQFVL